MINKVDAVQKNDMYSQFADRCFKELYPDAAPGDESEADAIDWGQEGEGDEEENDELTEEMLELMMNEILGDEEEGPGGRWWTGEEEGDGEEEEEEEEDIEE
jgi:hypothetical protein